MDCIIIRILNTITILAILTLSGCDNENPNKPSNSEALEGTWTESFEWVSLDRTLQYVDELPQSRVSRTTIITFEGDIFSAMILPPVRIIITTPESVYVGNASDTLFTGHFEISYDTLTFVVSELEKSERFRYYTQGGDLNLFKVAKADTNGYLLIEPRSFLWGYSDLKNFGVFNKVE